MRSIISMCVCWVIQKCQKMLLYPNPHLSNSALVKRWGTNIKVGFIALDFIMHWFNGYTKYTTFEKYMCMFKPVMWCTWDSFQMMIRGWKDFGGHKADFPFTSRKELLTILKGEKSLQNGHAPFLRPNPGKAQLCLTLCDPMGYIATRLLCPWNFPGKNTGVGCHSLLRGTS